METKCGDKLRKANSMTHVSETENKCGSMIRRLSSGPLENISVITIEDSLDETPLSTITDKKTFKSILTDMLEKSEHREAKQRLEKYSDYLLGLFESPNTSPKQYKDKPLK